MPSTIDFANYDFSLHRHNYAVWTASRAVQRGFASTETISKAIKESELREFAEDESECNENDFEIFHVKCSNQLINAFNDLGKSNVTYGRVAKIIAIYLKTSVIFPKNGKCHRSKIIHPPIDSILLTRISDLDELKDIKELRWTGMDQKEYWGLAYKIKDHFKIFDWTLEAYWSAD
jgi:hypothetical protein